MNPSRNNLPVIASMFTCLLFGGPWQIAHAEPTANIVFADSAVKQGNRIDPGEIKDSFACGEPIHTIVGVEGLTPGEHEMDTRWLSPSGEVVKSDSGRIQIPNEIQVAYMSSSITVQRDGDDDTGEQGPFSGKWTVEVSSDGSLVGSESVTVDC